MLIHSVRLTVSGLSSVESSFCLWRPLSTDCLIPYHWYINITIATTQEAKKQEKNLENCGDSLVTEWRLGSETLSSETSASRSPAKNLYWERSGPLFVNNPGHSLPIASTIFWNTTLRNRQERNMSRRDTVSYTSLLDCLTEFDWHYNITKGTFVLHSDNDIIRCLKQPTNDNKCTLLNVQLI